MGVIEEGAYADLLLINGEPIKDIRLLMDAEKNIDVSMKDAKIYKNFVRQEIFKVQLNHG